MSLDWLYPIVSARDRRLPCALDGTKYSSASCCIHGRYETPLQEPAP